MTMFSRPLAILMTLFFSLPVLAAPVAMVTDVAGEVTLDGQPLALLAELEPGSVLHLAGEGRVKLVYYASGQEYQVQGVSEAVLQADGVQADGKPVGGEAVLLSTEGSQLSSSQLSQAAIVMRSAPPVDQTLELTYPVWSTIMEPQPVFSWRVRGGNEKDYRYHLEILGENGKSLFAGESDIGRFRLPRKVDLPKGERLTWELEARKGGKMAFASADFRIAPDPVVERVDQLSRTVGEDFGRRVMFARYLEANGFKHDAENYWKVLASERPDQAVLRAKAAP